MIHQQVICEYVKKVAAILKQKYLLERLGDNVLNISPYV